MLAEVDRTLIEILPGDLPEDQRRRDALQGLAVAASEWVKVVDLLPYLQSIQSFTASVLDQAIKELPQLENFQDWLPPNWLQKPELNLVAAMDVLRSGIPLIWVPRAPIVSDLLGARNTMRRDAILAHKSSVISQDCLSMLDEVTMPQLEPLARLAKRSVESLISGFQEPAQALAANVFETWLREAVDRDLLFPPRQDGSVYTHVKNHVAPISTHTLLEKFREVCVLTPATVALVNYTPPGPPPSRFSRHATAHHARPESYTSSNAVVAVMLATSVLREAQELGW